MDKTKAPEGKTDIEQSLNRKIIELAMASPSNFSIQISPYLCFSKVGVFNQWSNNMKIKSLFQKYILPKDVNFIKMLQNQSSATHEMIEDLHQCFMQQIEKKCKSILEDEHKTKVLKNKNMEELLNAFITPIDRESIYRAITQLDWIAISVKHFVLETKAYDIDKLIIYQEILNLILEASDALNEGFASLGTKQHSKISKLCDKTRNLTDKISQQYIVEMVKLSNEKDIKQVFIYKEILTQLREIARRHHISANTLQDIVVKLE